MYILKINNLCLFASQTKVFAASRKLERPKRHIPTREQELKSLQTETFDVLIIGGGATGAGCALDSVTRGKCHLDYVISCEGYRLSCLPLIYRFENCFTRS